jgi:Kef-type K+ transport system membrane component KefB
LVLESGELMSNFQISYMFFLQLAAILAASRVVAWVVKRVGQPPVVAEMIAGVLLGPSLFGVVAPEASAWLFPKASMPVIYTGAQFALALYMFLVGVEFRLDLVRSKLRSAVSISVAGMVVPFALGAGLSLMLGDRTDLFGAGVRSHEAALYLGAAMCITAFPMLARIIQEGGLGGTSMGALALAAGSIDDAAAWCVLAVVLASFGGDSSIAILAIGGGVGYVLFVGVVLRPVLGMLARSAERAGRMENWHLASVMVLLMLASWFTDRIGLYAVFGAFVLGVAIPRGVLTRGLIASLLPLSSVVLLPLFFVCSGLNTKITLVNSWSLALIAVLVLFAACVGKGAACAVAAKLNGEGWRESLAIGSLMNARGLMELIILNIGLERGIITPTLFSIMVVMAIVTTLMATPAFGLALGRTFRERVGVTPAGP